MPRFKHESTLGFSVEQLFQVASDVERYPEFLPLCRAARILERDGNDLLVDNLYGNALVRIHFRTRARFDPPNGLEISAVDGPFEKLDITWRFEEAADGKGARVVFTMDQQFRHGLLNAAAAIFGGSMEMQTIRAFERRVGDMFGERR